MTNEKSIIEYLNHARKSPNCPPAVEEIQTLISYLRTNKLDPIIVGALAVVSYLQPVGEYFRQTEDVDIFITQSPPSPPPGWTRDRKSVGVPSWISPTGSHVDFLIAGHQFPDGSEVPKNIEKNRNATNNWPIADLTSLFLLKLNSFRDKDLFDLVELANKVGIPDPLKNRTLNETQRNNLETIRLYLQHKDLLK